MSDIVVVHNDDPIVVDYPGGGGAASAEAARVALLATQEALTEAEAAAGAANAGAAASLSAASNSIDAEAGAVAAAGDADLAKTAAETAEAGAAAIEAAILADLAGVTLTDLILTAATRTILAALNTSTGLPAVLTEAGREGIFKLVAYSSVSASVTADTLQGIYVRSTDDTSKVWVRQFSGLASTNWWGSIPDWNGTTGSDNADAFECALDTLQTRAKVIVEAGGVWFNGEALMIGVTGQYYTSRPFNIKHSISRVDFTGTEIVIATNSFGIVINADTTDIEAARTSGPWPLNLVLVNPTVRGHNGSDRTKHGIWMRYKCVIIKARVFNVSGDGIRIGNSNGHTDGNQNGWQLSYGEVQSCGGDGVHVEGGDSNGGLALNLTIVICGRFGIRDKSFLGCRWIGCVVENCGVLYSGVNSVPSFVFYSSRNWAIVDGQEANTTVTPSTSRLDVWIDMGAASSGDPAIPNWTSGIAMEAGGAIGATAATCSSHFVGPHIESYAVAQLGQYVVIDHLAGVPIVRGGIIRSPYINDRVTPGLEAYFTSPTGVTSTLLGGAKDQFAKWIGEDGHDWSLRRSGGYMRLRSDYLAVDVLAINETNARINTIDVETAYYFSGQKVIGARGAALPADATDLASAIALVNAIKARVKTTGGHGLVAD